MRLLRLRSVLIATDLGDTSLPALRAGSQLARLAGAEFHLVHAAERDTVSSERLREQLRRAAEDAPEPNSTCVAPGEPATAIVVRAHQIGADAVLLGLHRRDGSGSWIGSTAARVLRSARCPCLVAATGLRLPLKRVIVALDEPEMAAGLLSVALSWTTSLRPRDGRVRVTMMHAGPGDPDAATVRTLHEEIGRARARAGGSPQIEIEASIAWSADAAVAILRCAAEEMADLVVMGARDNARPGPPLGSVAEAVAREAPCPLVLVPASVCVASLSPPETSGMVSTRSGALTSRSAAPLPEMEERLWSELRDLSHELTRGGCASATESSPGGIAARQDAARRRITLLRHFVDELPRVDPALVWEDRAGYGSSVLVRGPGDGREHAYTLLLGEVLDTGANPVLLGSPLGQALIGCRAGEEVIVETLVGTRLFQVVAVETLPQSLGLVGPLWPSAGREPRSPSPLPPPPGARERPEPTSLASGRWRACR